MRSLTHARAVPLLAVAGAVAALATVPGSAAAATGRVETRLPQHGPIADVAVSQVTIDAPLPASAGPHPAACDTLSYLRYRHVRGPAGAAQAARILVAQPGGTAGAASLDQIARHTVQNAAAAGGFVEFWALDRRSLDSRTAVAKLTFPLSRKSFASVETAPGRSWAPAAAARR
jgi:hypothetical protein